MRNQYLLTESRNDVAGSDGTSMGGGWCPGRPWGHPINH